jgi:hypothetical protein
LFASLRCCDGDETTITAYFDKNNNNLTVKLTGEKVTTNNKYNYKITIKHEESRDVESFNQNIIKKHYEKPGTYNIEVKWNGEDDGPKQMLNKHEDSSIQTFTVTNPPRISDVKLGATDVSKQLYVTVTVEIDSSVSVLVSQIEYSYSIDSYTAKYQDSNVFKNLPPGNYTFYARNASDTDKFHTMDKILDTIKKTSPTDSILNDLLKRIANENYNNAYDSWIDQVGKKIPVIGIESIPNSSHLIDYVHQTKKKDVSVRTVRDSNDKIIKIIVKQ